LESGFKDFRNELGLDIKSYIEEMKKDNINKIKENLIDALKSFGGSDKINSFEAYMKSP
jgi:hypothetical protein